MLQHRATTTPPSAFGLLPEIMNRYLPAPGVEVPIASGARQGFEGLIAKRGRQDNCIAARLSMVHAVPRAVPRVTDTPALQVGVAKSREQFEGAAELLRRRYAWRGYSLDSSERQGPSECGAESPNNIAFFAADEQATLGTITLRLDGPEGLRAETTHREAVHRARCSGRNIGELTRLALAEAVDSRLVLSSLFGLVYAVGRWVHGVTDVFIEVNPRHVAFYARAIGFKVVGETRFCERVGAPSVLLHADVDSLEERLGIAAKVAAEEPLMRYGT